MHGILTGDTREVWVLTAAWSPYVQTDENGAIDRTRYWAGGSQWSPSIGSAVLFQSHAAAEEQVRHMNLREWSIYAVAIPELRSSKQ